MIDPTADALADELRRLVRPHHLRTLDDRDLLRRFAADRDEAAFAELVRRHGGMVLGVARRVVGHAQDAEDVFQATFLVLARKAGAVREPSVAAFLHGVTARLGRKALGAAARRRRHETAVGVSARTAEPDPTRPLELRQWIDVELARLAETLRLPIVLCLVEGQTQAEAARRLGWLPRTLKARLRRGREVLRQRLKRGGMSSAVALEGVLQAAEVVPAGLASGTVRLAVLIARGEVVEPAAAPVLALAGAGLPALAWGRFHAVLAALLVLGLAGLAAGWFAGEQAKGEKKDPPKRVSTPAVDRHGDPLPAGAVARLGTVRFRHQGFGLAGLAALNDQTILSVGEDNRVCWWDVQTGRPLRSFRIPDVQVRSFALSRDGKHLAVGGSRIVPDTTPHEGLVRVLDPATGNVVREFKRGSEGVQGECLAFTPNGKLLASITYAGTVRVEDVATGVEIHRETVALGGGSNLAISADGRVLAIYGRKVYVWEWQSGKPPREVPHGWYGAHWATLSPDGRTLVTDAHEEGIRYWDVGTGKLVRAVSGSASNYSQRARISPDGRYLVSASVRETPLLVRDFSTGKEVRRWELEGVSRFEKLSFTPDSRRLAVSVSRNALAVWEVATGKELLSPEGHRDSPSFVAFLPGAKAVTAGDDGTARLWDARTGKQLRELRATSHWVRGAAVSPDGKWLATSHLGQKPAVCLWDVGSGKQVHELKGHGSIGGHRPLRFTPDGKHLLSWGDDQYLRKWHVRTGKALAEHAIRPDGLPTPDENDDRETKWQVMDSLDRALFTADGSRLVLCGYLGVHVFDSATGKQLVRFDHEAGDTIGRALSPDGQLLLTSGFGKSHMVRTADGGARSRRGPPEVSVRELATGKLVWHRQIEGRVDRMGQVAFSPDGKTYAVGIGASPARIEFGDAATGKVTAVLRDVPAGVEAVAFSPDGKQLVAGLRDTTAVIWPLSAVRK